MRKLTSTAVAAGILLGGCAGQAGNEEGGDATEHVAETQAAIQGGQLETGFPAVGFVSSSKGSCTGALISSNFVLTAAHCAGSSMTFSTGTSPTNFVSHTVDQQVQHPSKDLLLLHLSAPVTSIAPIRLNTGKLPGVNQICTAVGFGIHENTDGTTTSGVKRSCSEQVESADGSDINVKMVTGISDFGDSGGPLVCNGTIAAVTRSKSDGSWPDHVRSTYTTVDLDWAASIVDDGFSAIVQSYPGLDFGLPSAWQTIDGDFNGDGKTDYARLGGPSAFTFISNGDGTFVGSPYSYGSLNFGLPTTWQVLVGDFNRDGRDDYIRLGGTGAWVFYGNPNGSADRFTRGFQSYVNESPALNFEEDSKWQSIVGDFNGDGASDYARLGATGAWLFYGNTDGSFTRGFQSYVDQSPQLNFGLPSTWQVVVGDFNRDGRDDYIRLGGTGSWLFFGNENRTFTRGFQSYVNESPALNFEEDSKWQSIAGDFNGDGASDYARLGATGAWLFFGNSNGTFKRTFQSYVDQSPQLNFGLPSTWQVVTGDFNGDTRADYARLGSTGAWVFTGNSDGTFSRTFQDYDGFAFGEASSYALVRGDFRGNGRTGYARLGGTEARIFVR